MVREQLPPPQNFVGRTLVRVHLIPYTPNTRRSLSFPLRSRHASDIQSAIHRAFPSRVLSGNGCSDSCAMSGKQRRNQHVAHLPHYQKLNENTLKKFSDEICPICHEGFKIGEYYRTLPICNHSFHKRCVDRWLRKDIVNMRCPCCRESHTPERWREHIERGQQVEPAEIHDENTRARHNVTVQPMDFVETGA